ncbi:hypothetical protein MASR1M101_37530 [Gemmatimonas sp.]
MHERQHEHIGLHQRESVELDVAGCHEHCANTMRTRVSRQLLIEETHSRLMRESWARVHEQLPIDTLEALPRFVGKGADVVGRPTVGGQCRHSHMVPSEGDGWQGGMRHVA